MTIVLAALLAAAPVALEADPNHSTVGFSVKHMVATTVRGAVHEILFHGGLEQGRPGEELRRAQGRSFSINTNNEKRDGQPQVADFLDVQGCPTCRSGRAFSLLVLMLEGSTLSSTELFAGSSLFQSTVKRIS